MKKLILLGLIVATQLAMGLEVDGKRVTITKISSLTTTESMQDKLDKIDGELVYATEVEGVSPYIIVLSVPKDSLEEDTELTAEEICAKYGQKEEDK